MFDILVPFQSVPPGFPAIFSSENWCFYLQHPRVLTRQVHMDAGAGLFTIELLKRGGKRTEINACISEIH